jgi:hypothetical protein
VWSFLVERAIGVPLCGADGCGVLLRLDARAVYHTTVLGCEHRRADHFCGLGLFSKARVVNRLREQRRLAAASGAAARRDGASASKRPAVRAAEHDDNDDDDDGEGTLSRYFGGEVMVSRARGVVCLASWFSG